MDILKGVGYIGCIEICLCTVMLENVLFWQEIWVSIYNSVE